MESLRVEKHDIYQIEVNDAGDTIEFDLVDISLPLRMDKAYQDIQKTMRWLDGQIALYGKKSSDEPKNGVLTPSEEKLLKAWAKAFRDMRMAMDSFLGEGGCQKIFGDRNYPEMFSDLFDQLEPHIEKMGLRSKTIQQRIEDKYRRDCNAAVLK